MTVVLATRLFPPEGGAAAYRHAALARALVRKGVRVEVLTTRPPGASGGPAPAQDGVAVRRWPVLRDRGGNVRGYVQYASFDLPLVGRLLATARPAAVVAEPPPTTGAAVRVACALRRVPYVYYAADVVSVAARGIGVPAAISAALERVERWVLRGAAAVLTVSDDVAAVIRELGADPRRVHVVGTGVDTGVFTPHGPVHECTRPTIVYAGTMSEIQGASVFVDAMPEVLRHVADARLVLLGQGTEVDQLRRAARSLPRGALEMPGVLGGAETARWLRSATVAVASVRPGRGYDMAFATKTFAATACGTPVVYAGAGPCGPIVRGNGLGQATAWEPGEVAAALVAALRSRPDAETRARLATWTQQHYSLDAVARRAADVVAGVVR